MKGYIYLYIYLAVTMNIKENSQGSIQVGSFKVYDKSKINEIIS